MLKKIHLGFFALLLGMSPLVQAATPDCTPIPAAQCNALVALYNATDGANWANTTKKWNAAVLNCTTSNWHGITCDTNGVTELSLSNNKLEGTIPSVLKNLTKLTKLDLSQNLLSGSIPSDLKVLLELRELDLSDNWLENSIPSDLKVLTKLTMLNLSVNDLIGSIPNDLKALTALTELDLSNNALSGEIPSDLKDLVKLTKLNLSLNALTGKIPSDLKDLIALTELDLSVNRLDGEIPSELGELTELTKLDLSDNSLTGEIPSELGALASLTELALSGNNLNGKIPEDLKDLTKLTMLDLSFNALSDGIPDLPTLETLKSLNLSNNKLSGKIPTNLATTLEKLNLSYNLLTGPIPDLSGYNNLITLLLNDNGLCGKIEDANLITTTITTLQVENNYLTATDSTLRQWLDEINPGWESGTACPAGKLQFASAKYSVKEGDDGVVTIDITVSRVDGNAGKVSVMCLSEDVNTTVGVDYNTAFSVLEWGTGNSDNKLITVTINPDTDNEPDEVFKLKLINAINAEIGNPNITEVTIANDDGPGTLQFSSATYSIAENGGTVTAKVSRVGGRKDRISVKCKSSDGTATAGEDYTAVDSLLEWGKEEEGEQDCKITITDDTFSEGDETFNLTLSEPVNKDNPGNIPAIGDPSTTVVTIPTNDSSILKFTAATYSVNEKDGTVSSTIYVNRSGDKTSAASVAYMSSDGTATAGTDYTPVAGTLEWGAGVEGNKSITVEIEQDDIPEGNETFNITLMAPTGAGIIGSPSATVVTITDDDKDYGKLQFELSTDTVNENEGSIDIIVKRVDGSDDTVYVKYRFKDGTAENGKDYTGTDGSLTWNGGDVSNRTITVPISNDGSGETDETFTVELRNPKPSGGPELGEPKVITVTIIDKDESTGILQFAPATYSVEEDGIGTVKLTVTRKGGTYGAAAVIYTSSSDGHTATAVDDYTPVGGPLNWTDGDSSPKTITVEIINDTEFEPDDETFKVELSNATGATLGASDTAAVVTIVDDEIKPQVTLQFSESTYSIGEDKVARTITVTRKGGSDGAVSVEYATSNDTPVSAEAGKDYTETTGELSWADGNDDDQEFKMEIINDEEVEDPDETFIVTLGNPDGAELGTPATTVVTIEDDGDTDTTDCLTVSISQKQCEALVALYKDTKGEKWTNNDGWNETQEPCDWHGVKCDDNEKKVLELDLSDNGLTGAIPKAFFKLKKLTVLDLSSNNLEGTDLAQFKSLKKLKTLLLNDCLLYGDIPEIWRKKLKKLKKLNIKDNCLNTQVSTPLKDWLDNLNPGWNENQTSCFR